MSLDPAIARRFSLADRVAVITGAASGIGREAACVFAQAGARVLLADIDAAGLELTAASVREAGGEAFVRRVNVAEGDEVQQLADAAARDCGRLDAWINSAGIVLWAGATEAAPAAVERVVAVNMLGTYWGCTAAGRVMRSLGHGGAIVNVSSTAGESPMPSLSAYGMTKAAVNQLTRVCAKEFGAFGVRVNAVAPGFIDTPINASAYRDADGAVDPVRREELLRRMAALSPLGLTGEAGDVALALLYLATDASRFVTGHVLRVSGGV